MLVMVGVGRVSATVTWESPRAAEFAAGVQPASTVAVFNSVSCASDGNCTAVGQFFNSSGGYEAFTVTQTAGVWGQATPAVFPSGAQSGTPNAVLNSVSCASAGNCTAVGKFRNAAQRVEAFTMTQTAEVWSEATSAVFGAGLQNAAPDAVFNSVSCASAGNCTAVGSFKNAGGTAEAFTMTSTNGTWGQATQVAFAAGVQYGAPTSTLKSVSCVSAGNCVAVGQFKNAAQGVEAFTVTQTAGVWGDGAAASFANGVQRTSPNAIFNSVSCVSAGNCTAAGQFQNPSNGIEAFTMTSTNGTWGQATPAAFAAGVYGVNRYSVFNSVSCVSAGNCVAVGMMQPAAGGYEAFTMTSTNDTWGDGALAVFGSGVQAGTPSGMFWSVSCASAGNCVAVGQFKNAANLNESFTMTSTGGTWGNGAPTTFASGVQDASPDAAFKSVSCPSTTYCSAVGQFRTASTGVAALLMNSPYTPPPAPSTTVAEATSTTVAGSAAPTTVAGSTASTATPRTTSPAVAAKSTNKKADSALPATGSEHSTEWLTLGLGAVVVGGMLLARRRRMI